VSEGEVGVVGRGREMGKDAGEGVREGGAEEGPKG